jgi:hypothetical protein
MLQAPVATSLALHITNLPVPVPVVVHTLLVETLAVAGLVPATVLVALVV